MKAPTDPLTQTTEQKALHVASLLYGYIWESLTPEEHDELDNWVGESDENMYLFEELTDEKNIKKALDWLTDSDGESMARKLKGRIRFSESGARIRIMRQVRKYAVAASVILVISTSAIYLYRTFSNKNNNGSNIAASPENFISAPTGATRTVTLPDGTIAWLNAASSIRFPEAFTGNERRVLIDGEVYFEVTTSIMPVSGQKKPFIVALANRGITVEVLGTHFDVNSYTDDPVVKTTLLEGSIKISSGKETRMVKPGQQALIAADQHINLAEADTEDAIAWKRGEFSTPVDIGSFLKEVSRWYGVQVEYAQGKVPEKGFSGAINRSISLDEIMKILELNAIHTRLEGKKLIVSS